MHRSDTVVAVYADHEAAESAVKKLAAAGFDVSALSVVGKGYHTEEKVVGFYNAGDRIKFWGARGAIWGGLWGLFVGGLFIAVPLIGPVVILGTVAATAISAIESALVVGGLSVLGAAIYSLGVPKDSVLAYEAAIKADHFLVMAHGASADLDRAKTILAGSNPNRLDLHKAANAVHSADHLVMTGS